MRKLIYIAGTVAILAAALVVVQRARPSPLPPQSQPIPPSGTACNGTYSGTFSGNLTVSNGQSCDFVGGGANGNVTLTGGQLLLSNAKIAGNVQGSGKLALSGSGRVAGNVTLTGGQLSLGSGASVGGNLTLAGAVTFSIGPFATVTGNVQVSNLPTGSGQDSICGAQVQANLQFTNNGTSTAIGSLQSSCAGNAIRGNLQVDNNTAATTIDGNTVGGNLQVDNNTAAIQILGNTVNGNLQCQNNSMIAVGTNTAKQTQGQCVPIITWSVPQVTFFVLPGDISLRTITFASGVPLLNGSLEAVPEIAPFLKLTPGTMASVPANQSQTVQIQATIPVGTSVSSTYAGTIQIRAGGQIIPETLKVTIAMGPPPDPGTAGTATLAGIDSDGNGVRDDVQRYIDLSYPGSAKERSALSQVASALQDEITGVSSGTREGDSASDCLGSVLMTSDADVAGGANAFQVLKMLRLVVLNTPARAQAFFNFDSSLGSAISIATPYAQQASECLVPSSLFPN